MDIKIEKNISDCEDVANWFSEEEIKVNHKLL